MNARATTARRLPGLLALIPGLALAACEDSTGPGFTLEIETTGRLERSSTVSLTVTLSTDTVAPEELVWSAEPADAVEFVAADRVRLLSAGTVRLDVQASLPDRVVTDFGRIVLEVPPPPTVVFDLVREGSRDIYRSALDGLDLVRLTEAAGDDIDPGAVAGTVVFTSFRDGNAELYSVPLDGGPAARLTTSAAAEIQPALSPDGSALAYASDADGLFRIFRADPDGGGALALTDAFGAPGSIEASPVWSPDGARLAFVSTTNGTADLFELALPDGEPAALLVGPAANVEPAWSPDGDSVVFASDSPGDTELFVLDVTGEVLTRLTDRPGTDGEPAWLPDGRIVYTAFDDAGGSELRWLDPADPDSTVAIPLDGESPRRPAAVRN